VARIVSPFGARSTALEVIASTDLSGKRAIVTGATSGIGVETARALAKAGAAVTLGVRDVARGAEVVRAIVAQYPKAKLHVIALDLASHASVKGFAKAYFDKNTSMIRGVKPLHILINNAGIMATPEQRTAEGFELQFGTNHIGHFLLANLLLPALSREGARIVSLSSIGHRRSDIVWDDIHFRNRPYEKWSAYGQSKTANALFALGATAQWAKYGIYSNAVMPGGIMTGLQENLTQAEMQALGWIDDKGAPNPGMKTPEQGAATSVWAATSPLLNKTGGLYLEDCAEAEPWAESAPWQGVLPYAIDPGSANRLWQVTRAMISL
jgi:NAD(P)-dependent dehydrogenase (short-subunit alcohol dehydrogenase family)